MSSTAPETIGWDCDAFLGRQGHLNGPQSYFVRWQKNERNVNWIRPQSKFAMILIEQEILLQLMSEWAPSEPYQRFNAQYLNWAPHNDE